MLSACINTFSIILACCIFMAIVVNLSVMRTHFDIGLCIVVWNVSIIILSCINCIKIPHQTHYVNEGIDLEMGRPVSKKVCIFFHIIPLVMYIWMLLIYFSTFQYNWRNFAKDYEMLASLTAINIVWSGVMYLILACIYSCAYEYEMSNQI